MRKESIAPPKALNGCLITLFILLSIYQLFILPLFIPQNTIYLIMLILPIILLNNTFWSLIHEGIHCKLTTYTKTNDMLSRLLSILYGSPFRALQIAHLLHHKYNRTPYERNEMYNPECVSPLHARITFYFRLFAGVYVQEIILPIIVLLPLKTLKDLLYKKFPKDSYQRIVIDTFLKKDKNLTETRYDFLCVIILFISSFYIYGRHWPLLVMLLLIRALFISFFDYSYHYGTKTDDVSFAMNFSLPKWISKLILHFNYHGTHHQYPLIPWHALPQKFESEQGIYEKSLFSGAARQLKGPLPLSE